MHDIDRLGAFAFGGMNKFFFFFLGGFLGFLGRFPTTGAGVARDTNTFGCFSYFKTCHVVRYDLQCPMVAICLFVCLSVDFIYLFVTF